MDRMSVERFAQGRHRYLAELAQALRDGSYCPLPVRRVYIPKGKKQRPLGIPAVKDRVVQAALKLVIEPIFEHDSSRGASAFGRVSAAKMRCVKWTGI